MCFIYWRTENKKKKTNPETSGKQEVKLAAVSADVCGSELVDHHCFDSSFRRIFKLKCQIFSKTSCSNVKISCFLWSVKLNWIFLDCLSDKTDNLRTTPWAAEILQRAFSHNSLTFHRANNYNIETLISKLISNETTVSCSSFSDR